MHRPTGETVLLYGFTDPQRTREIQYVLVQMGIRVKMISDDQLGQTVGFLAGMKDMEENPNPEKYEAFGKEVMIMHNFSINKRINLMLTNFQRRGLGNIPLKCVVTGANKKMTFYELAQDLEKELAMLEQGMSFEEIKAEKEKEKEEA